MKFWTQIALIAVFAGASLCAAPQKSAEEQQQQEQAPPPQEPPEEDESAKPKEYGFNPLQASKEMKVGQFYFKKKSWKAAANRFAEATKWDPTNAEAFLKWGESLEKLNDKEGAREAFSKYVEMEPDSKTAKELKKRWKL